MADSQEPDFLSSWKYGDITFSVNNKFVHVSKLILSLWSPVFEAMFTNNFREKTAEVIELPGKELDPFLSLMRVLHPPNDEICGM